MNAQTASGPASLDFAVVVGIGTYGHFSHLHGPDHDTDDIVRWLNKDEGIPKDHIFCLRSRDFPAEHKPRRACVDAWFLNKVINPLSALIDAGQQPDKGWGRLFLYFAGHGGWNMIHPDDAYLFGAPAVVPKGGTVDSKELIHLRQIVHYFHESMWFREVVLLVDACREARQWNSTYTTGDLKWRAPAGDFQRWSRRRVSTLLAFAAGRGDLVQERMIGRRKRGVFTYFFRHALRRAPRASDGRVDAEDLGSFLEAALDAYHTSRGDFPIPTDADRLGGAWEPARRPPQPEFTIQSGGGRIYFSPPHRDPCTEVEVFFQLDRDERPDDKERISLAPDPARHWAVLVRPQGAGWDEGTAIPIASDNCDSAGPFTSNPDTVYESSFGYSPQPIPPDDDARRSFETVYHDENGDTRPAPPDDDDRPQLGLILPPPGWVQVRGVRFRLVPPRQHRGEGVFLFQSGGQPPAGVPTSDGVPGFPHNWGVTHVRV